MSSLQVVEGVVCLKNQRKVEVSNIKIGNYENIIMHVLQISILYYFKGG